MSFETLLLDIRDGVARITLDRQREANAINLQMAKDLMYATLQCDEDPSVRAVLLSASGKMFCAGGDLAAFAGSGDGLPALLKEMTTYLHASISRLARMRAPVLVSVGGTAAGAGFSLVCGADLAICAESAKFTMAYTRVGLTPDGSATYFLPRLIGRRRTLELMISNRMLTAAEALEWGIVNRVVPDDQLQEATEKLIAELAAGATGAFGATKALLLASATNSLESQMELETRSIADSARSQDAKEGIQAFSERRAPRFSGR